MNSQMAKDQRLNVRLTSDALEQIKVAASISGQDVSSFVLSAALDRARMVLAEDRFLSLTPHEVVQLEKSLDQEPTVVPQLASLLRRLGAPENLDGSNRVSH